MQLKPCPFCGDVEPTVERYGDRRQSTIIVCSYCGCRVESGDEGERYGDSWNRRVLTDDDERPIGARRSARGIAVAVCDAIATNEGRDPPYDVAERAIERELDIASVSGGDLAIVIQAVVLPDPATPGEPKGRA